jgi:hypothetical protein
MFAITCFAKNGPLAMRGALAAGRIKSEGSACTMSKEIAERVSLDIVDDLSRISAGPPRGCGVNVLTTALELAEARLACVPMRRQEATLHP